MGVGVMMLANEDHAGLLQGVGVDRAALRAEIRASRKGEACDIGLRFATVAAKTYRLESSDTLQSGSWTVRQAGIAGTVGAIQLTGTDGALSGRRFYRIVVEP